VFGQARGTLGNPSHGEYVFHTNPYHRDHFVDSHEPFYSCVPPVLCEYCESSGHDACNCPYHEYVDATCASVEKTINEMTNQMIETMK